MPKQQSRWKKFLVLWVFLFVTFLAMKVIYNLWFYGWIDLRKGAILEVLILPMGQAILFWFAYRFDKR